MSVSNSQILLRTALVPIEHMGELYRARAFIDPGFQRTFVTDNFMKRLQVPTRRSNYEVYGIWEKPGSTTRECDLTIFSEKTNSKFSVTAILLPNVEKYIPLTSFEVPHCSNFESLDLADPKFNQRSQVDIILGNDCERHFNLEGRKTGIGGLASAYNTIFGWVICGPMDTQVVQSFTTTVVPSKTVELNDLLRKFWEQEELPSPMHTSDEDHYCEEFYKQTTTRQSDGRYVVRLPFKKEFPDSIFLGASRILSLGQYSHMRQSLSKNPELQAQYKAVLDDYLTLGHI